MTTPARLGRLVGNPNAYAEQHSDGSWTPVRKPLTDAVLQDHLDLKRTIGTYINDGDQARLLVFDIDDGDKFSASAITEELDTLGVPLGCVGLEDSGRKGFHVWVPIQEWVSAHDLRRLGRVVVAAAGLPADTEVFPKQDEVRDLGNLVKLPDGEHQVTGNPNPMLGAYPRPLPVRTLNAILAGLPAELKAARPPSETRFPCMEAIQEEGAAEGGRNIQLYHLAAMLRRAGVSEHNVETIVRRANGIGDELEEAEMLTVLSSSGHGGPICAQLPEERQCGELCIMERTKGLYTRPGQLRHAGEGENVVVTLTGRKGKVIEFAHDDISRAKGVLRD